MKKALIFIMIFGLSIDLLAQTDNAYSFMERKSLTIGVLQGGGSLIGADLEILITNHIGIQIGMGFIGYGAGLNYHFKPTIRSSFLSLQYWNQGIGNSFAQNAIGPNFVFRGKRWFTCQIGIGKTLEEGPAMPDDFEQPDVMLLYSIGFYIPSK
ncbi:MAG: hypothetical protein CVU03_14030 [Bacteroidetes bacterium HGW-Bacteroidetes-2]|jgi:hypothetical protein|nr:MAG: hypothetical protein CVU03_14030 [Bacteroidetes bacterium HGW-Bacteroidetes-2]